MMFTGKRIDNDKQIQGCLLKSRKCTIIVPVEILEDRSQARYDTDSEIVIGVQTNAIEVYPDSVSLCYETGAKKYAGHCPRCKTVTTGPSSVTLHECHDRIAVKELKSVLCDPDGKVSITGTDEDRRVVQKALGILDNFLTP